MHINTTGLVLRETAYKESSKILTVLTGKEGKLTVTARGATRKNSKLAAAAQLLVFSEMTLFNNRDRWTLTEARSIEQFRGLQFNVADLALGSYFAELTEAVADEDSPNPQLLPLCLNALFALSEGVKEAMYVKPAFEFRLMAVSGYSPLISHCSLCGRENPERAFLDLAGGTLNCTDCSPSGGAPLNRSALSAARYIISCDPKRIFSFSLGNEALGEIAAAAEGYLQEQLGRRFRTLEFFKQLKTVES